MYRSTNRQGSLAEPEIWFRIVHVAVDGAPVAAYREQTVEIALGPLPAPQAADAARQAGMVRRPAITERALRPIAQMEDHAWQRSAFALLLEDPDRSIASA